MPVTCPFSRRARLTAPRVTGAPEISYYLSNMKTIAISIDEASLAALDRLARGGRNRSELVRQAVAELVKRLERERREVVERKAIARHRRALSREAAALVADQADP
jgi:metal-responsive CopG/Arc/MetJ family transcriptional regulator